MERDNIASNNQIAKTRSLLIYLLRMSLANEIESLFNDIGTGITESAIRARLSVLKEQAEALDAALKEYDTALAECNSALHDACADLERLKTDTKAKKSPPDENALTEGERELMEILRHSSGTTWISEVQTQYHADKLEEKGLIGLGATVLRGGKMRVRVSLTEQGRKYLFESP